MAGVCFQAFVLVATEHSRAISKQGVISGTLKNTITGSTQPLEGMADKTSQRVAWSVTGQQRPIMETGLSNLTQDASPALIHFSDGQTQQCSTLYRQRRKRIVAQPDR
jgi:hypothetical protein